MAVWQVCRSDWQDGRFSGSNTVLNMTEDSQEIAVVKMKEKQRRKKKRLAGS